MKLATLALVAMAGAASAQASFEIYVDLGAGAGADVNALPGDVVTATVYGTWSGISDSGNGNALGGFGIDAANDGADGIGAATVNPNLILGSDTGALVDTTIEGVKGGQLANLFGQVNPNVDLSNPIMLFSYDITVGGSNVSVYPTNPNPNGGLIVYPDSQSGDQDVSGVDGPLTLTGANIIVPAPAGLAVLGLGLAARRRR